MPVLWSDPGKGRMSPCRGQHGPWLRRQPRSSWTPKGRAPAASTRKTAPAGRRTSPPPAKDRPRAGSGAVVRPEAGGTPLRIPFGNKEAAQKLGVRYGAGGYYAPPGVALDPFRERGWM